MATPFCDQCGKAVPTDAAFCPGCGRRFQTSPLPPIPPSAPTAPSAGPIVVVTESKNPGVAALLAFLVGIGFMGVGHIYVGKIGRGIVLLIVGIALRGLVAFALIWGFFAGLGAFILLALVSLALWAWQTYDAYKLAKQFNVHVQQYGKAPW